MKLKNKQLLSGIIGTFLLTITIACGQNSSTTITPTDSQMPGKGIEVKAGTSISTYGLFTTEIVNIGLEKLGYKTEPIKQLNIPIAHLSVANRQLDFYGAHWEKLQNQFFIQSGGEAKMQRLGFIVMEALQGYQIDRKTAEKYNITNIDQLKDPKIAKLFDSDDDGKANLTGCNPGWGCELVIEHHLDSYQLRNTVEHDQGNYDLLITNMITRYQQGKPVLYYAYTPYWLSVILKPGENTNWLEVPFTSLPEKHGKISERETLIDGKNLGFAIDNVKILANNEFLEDNPAAKRLFEVISIPIEDINIQQKLVYDGENTPADIRRHAEEWVEKNQEKFDGWLKQAIAMDN